MIMLPNTRDLHWRNAAVKSIVSFAKLKKKLGQNQKARFSSLMVEKNTLKKKTKLLENALKLSESLN